MLFYDLLNVTQSKAKSLYIMNIPRRHTVEFLKYAFLVFLLYSNTIISHPDMQLTIFIEGLNPDLGIITGLLNGIIYKV